MDVMVYVGKGRAGMDTRGRQSVLWRIDLGVEERDGKGTRGNRGRPFMNALF